MWLGARRPSRGPVTISEGEWVMHDDVQRAVLVEVHEPGVFLVVGHGDLTPQQNGGQNDTASGGLKSAPRAGSTREIERV